ncbi:MAG: hypothetical protein ACREP6_10515 [Candidatus Binataceae bacterium]
MKRLSWLRFLKQIEESSSIAASFYLIWAGKFDPAAASLTAGAAVPR